MINYYNQVMIRYNFYVLILSFFLAQVIHGDESVKDLNLRVLQLEKEVSELKLMVSKLIGEKKGLYKAESSSKLSTRSTFGTILKAVQSFRLKRRRLPVDLNELKKARFIVHLPKDGWGNEIKYKLLNKGKSFELISYGEDNKEGGLLEYEDLKLSFP